jgi:hypothetical protein
MGRPSPERRSRSTSDKSPVRKSRTPGSVGEVLGNQHLYPTVKVDHKPQAFRWACRPARLAFLDGEYQSFISLETRLFMAAVGETVFGHADERTGDATRVGWVVDKRYHQGTVVKTDFGYAVLL